MQANSYCLVCDLDCGNMSNLKYYRNSGAHRKRTAEVPVDNLFDLPVPEPAPQQTDPVVSEEIRALREEVRILREEIQLLRALIEERLPPILPDIIDFDI